MRYPAIIFSGLMMVVASCTSTTSNKSADEQERPADWSAQWRFTLEVDQKVRDRDVVMVKGFETDQSMNDLIEQLFSMAFSGEAQVHLPDLFGGINLEEEVGPEALVSALRSYDTVAVEDIYTGEISDTVVDNSFTVKDASALVLTMSITGDGPTIDLKANHAALGVQVFDPITAKRRGDSKRFYLYFNDAGNSLDHLKIYSDSLGQYRPSFFEVYPDETDRSLKDIILNAYGPQIEVELTMRVELSFNEGLLRVKNVELSPLASEA